MPLYKVNHITRYTYATPVVDCSNQLMLYPVEDQYQEVKEHELKITQHPLVEVFTDYFGNRIGVFSLIKPHDELVIESQTEVMTNPIAPPEDTVSPIQQWEQLITIREQFPYIDFLSLEIIDSMHEVKAEVKKILNYSLTPYTHAIALTNYVYEKFEYRKGVTNVETQLDEIWRLKAGVCQDFAHMLIVMLRIIEIPARYVSGYICPKDHEQRGEGATHAWVEAYIPNYGWIGLDPTNNVIVNDYHIRLAVGRNFTDCTPVKGTYKGSSEHTLEVSVRIENGQLKSSDSHPEQPTFSYHVQNPSIPLNSYRYYMEMQQQQQ